MAPDLPAVQCSGVVVAQCGGQRRLYLMGLYDLVQHSFPSEEAISVTGLHLMVPNQAI